MPIKTNNAIIIGINTALKYGAPTDIFPMPIASIISGYKVPNKMVTVAVIKIDMAIKIVFSREYAVKRLGLLTLVARNA